MPVPGEGSEIQRCEMRVERQSTGMATEGGARKQSRAQMKAG